MSGFDVSSGLTGVPARYGAYDAGESTPEPSAALSPPIEDTPAPGHHFGEPWSGYFALLSGGVALVVQSGDKLAKQASETATAALKSAAGSAAGSVAAIPTTVVAAVAVVAGLGVLLVSGTAGDGLEPAELPVGPVGPNGERQPNGFLPPDGHPPAGFVTPSVQTPGLADERAVASSSGQPPSEEPPADPAADASPDGPKPDEAPGPDGPDPSPDKPHAADSVPPPKTARPRRPGDTDVDPRPPSTGSVGSSGRPSQRPEGGTLGEEVAWAAKEAERLLASGAPPASVRAHVEYIKELAQRALEGEEGAPAPADSEGQASLPPAPTTEIGMTAGGLTDSQLELGLAWLEKIQVGPAEGAALRGSARPTPNVNLLDARGRPVPAWEPWNKEGRALGFDEIVKALKQYADSPDVEVDPEPFPRDDRGDSPGHSVGSTPPTPGEEPISVRFEALLQDSKELREKERGEEP